MRKQTLLFVFALAFTLLAGCWNKPFDPEAWNATEDEDYETANYKRCAMGVSLLKKLPGMSVEEYNKTFGQNLESKSSKDFIDVGACKLGCHGGGIVFIKVEIKDGKVVKAEQYRS